MYTQYIKSYNECLTVLQKLTQNSQVKKFLDVLVLSCAIDSNTRQETLDHPDVNGQSMNAFLIKPVQRIPRYELLLKVFRFEIYTRVTTLGLAEAYRTQSCGL